MWIARRTATSPHTHSPAKRQTFLNLDYNVKTHRSDSNLDWNGLSQNERVGMGDFFSSESSSEDLFAV